MSLNFNKNYFFEKYNIKFLFPYNLDGLNLDLYILKM